MVVLFHVRPVPRVPTEVPRRLTEETVRGDTAAVPLVTYDFLDFNIGPQVCYIGGLAVLLSLLYIPYLPQPKYWKGTLGSDRVHHTCQISYNMQ